MGFDGAGTDSRERTGSHEPDFHQPDGLFSCAMDAKSAFFLWMLVTHVSPVLYALHGGQCA